MGRKERDPRRDRHAEETQLPPELKKQNEDLKRKFQIRGFPTVLFLDANEKQIGRSGYKPGGPEKWIEDASKQIK